MTRTLKSRGVATSKNKSSATFFLIIRSGLSKSILDYFVLSRYVFAAIFASFHILPYSMQPSSLSRPMNLSMLDKAYSLTDCISMNAMRERGLTDILTNDHHFTQEGFHILL